MARAGEAPIQVNHGAGRGKTHSSHTLENEAGHAATGAGQIGGPGVKDARPSAGWARVWVVCFYCTGNRHHSSQRPRRGPPGAPPGGRIKPPWPRWAGRRQHRNTGPGRYYRARPFRSWGKHIGPRTSTPSPSAPGAVWGRVLCWSYTRGDLLAKGPGRAHHGTH